jgi:hypothetical protein
MGPIVKAAERAKPDRRLVLAGLASGAGLAMLPSLALGADGAVRLPSVSDFATETVRGVTLSPDGARLAWLDESRLPAEIVVVTLATGEVTVAPLDPALKYRATCYS